MSGVCAVERSEGKGLDEREKIHGSVCENEREKSGDGKKKKMKMKMKMILSGNVVRNVIPALSTRDPAQRVSQRSVTEVPTQLRIREKNKNIPIVELDLSFSSSSLFVTVIR